MEEISAAQIDSPFHFILFVLDNFQELLLIIYDAAIGYNDTIIV